MSRRKQSRLSQGDYNINSTSEGLLNPRVFAFLTEKYRIFCQYKHSGDKLHGIFKLDFNCTGLRDFLALLFFRRRHIKSFSQDRLARIPSHGSLFVAPATIRAAGLQARKPGQLLSSRAIGIFAIAFEPPLVSCTSRLKKLSETLAS